MKTILILLLTFSTISAFAISKQQCPKKINISIEKFQSLDQDRIDGYDDFIDDNPYLENSRSNLNLLTSFDFELNLSRAHLGKCFYQAQTTDTSVVLSAQISGTTRQGTSNPPLLKVYYSLNQSSLEDIVFDYVFYIPLSTTLSPHDGISLKDLNSLARIYYPGQTCSYGECAQKYIQIGLATDVDVQ